MSRHRFAIIANPTAGRRRRKRLDVIVERLRQAGAEVEIFHTSRAGEATQLARQAAAGRPDAVVAVGGDGTINEVLNGMVDTPVPLAILPFGTANVLGIEINAPRRPASLAAMLLHGAAIATRPGRVGGHFFLLMAGAGFDAEIVEEVSPVVKRLLGKGAYGLAALKRLVKRPLSKLIVSVGQKRIEGCWAVVGKIRNYGGQTTLAPQADLTNDAFEVCVFSPRSRLRLVWQLMALVCGRHLALHDVHCLSGERATIVCETRCPFQTDGDPRGVLPAEFVLHEQAINLIVPAKG